MLIGAMGRAAMCCAALLLAGCQQAQSSLSRDLAELPSRPIAFVDYPQPDTTYLSFSQSHGFQVNFIAANGRSWLWYPGNSSALAETWRILSAEQTICWGHPANSYNPVTGQVGTGESCERLANARRLTIARLKGDPYGLANGRVPYRLGKCQAPPEFDYDKQRYRCD